MPAKQQLSSTVAQLLSSENKINIGYDRLMLKISFIFLSLPYFIFALGWLRIFYALFVCLVLAVALWQIFVSANTDLQQEEESLIDVRTLSLIIIIILIWVVLSGVGGIGYQTQDYDKHNAVLRDLISNSWPVTYDNTQPGHMMLVYYIAYYLPAALVGKAMGWGFANIFILVWTICGIFLCIYWFIRIVGKNKFWIVILFIAFGGFDYFGSAFYGFPRTNYVAAAYEWWLIGFQYSANTTLLYWVPQHAFAGWLPIMLIMFQAKKHLSNSNTFFAVSLGILWSPLVFIGLVPFALIAVINKQYRTTLSFQNIVAAPIIAIIAVAFLTSNKMSGGSDIGWIWTIPVLRDFMKNIPEFIILEVGVYILIVAFLFKQYEIHLRMWFITAALCLLIIPFYCFGLNNDIVMRASIPSLLVLLVFITQTLDWEQYEYEIMPYLIVAVIAIGSINAVVNITFSLMHPHTITDSWVTLRGGGIYAKQYIALDTSNTPFFKYFAK